MCAGCSAGENGGLLKGGSVNERGRLSAQATMFYVSYYADDLPWARLIHGVRIVAQQDLLSDGVLVRKVFANERLVDDDHPGSVLGVVLIEIASFHQQNFHRAEDSGTYFAVSGTRAVNGRRRRMRED